jgi:hypothetical protein
MRSKYFGEGVSGIAMRTKYFGEGAERLVRKLRTMNVSGDFIGPLYVAKEGRFEGDWKVNVEFHKIFCETQSVAQELANDFNKRLSRVPGVDHKTPHVSFLECSVCELWDEKKEDWFSVLVEKQLDPEAYGKWSDNTGFVKGQEKMKPLQKEINLKDHLLDMIEEGEEDDDYDEGENAYISPPTINSVKHEDIQPAFSHEDVLQAFSHFTHRHTRRRMLVCDLQGVLNCHSSPPMFELTDPVIHHKSHTGKKGTFGRTDRGQGGIDDFYKTHKCNHLCHATNRRWVKRPATATPSAART